jgi:hypothetical protein
MLQVASIPCWRSAPVIVEQCAACDTACDDDQDDDKEPSQGMYDDYYEDDYPDFRSMNYIHQRRRHAPGILF